MDEIIHAWKIASIILLYAPFFEKSGIIVHATSVFIFFLELPTYRYSVISMRVRCFNADWDYIRDEGSFKVDLR